MKILSKRSDKKVGFLIVGTQKGGTTALAHYLKLHPDVGMSETKEIHFFDDEDRFAKSKPNYSHLERHFDFNDGKLIYGEATPIYMYWNDSPKRIWEYNPEMKIIVVLRNPIDRAYSHWNMERDRSWDLESFDMAVKNERARCKEALPLQHRIYSYCDRGFYVNQVRRLQHFFDDSQLLFIKYEDYKAEQKGYLEKVFKFLNVDMSGFEFEESKVHSRPYLSPMEDTTREFLRIKFHPEIEQLESLLGWDCSDWK